MRGTYCEAEEARGATARGAFLGLGSNQGDRAENLSAALRMIDAIEGVSVARISSVYETEPVGYADQPAFLNMVVRVRAGLSPEKLLDALKKIERDLGRTHGVRWGPRPIDLDILLIEGVRRDTSRLTIPHPRLTRRQFVLVPLAEIEPEVELPGGVSAGGLSAGVSEDVRLVGSLDELLAGANEDTRIDPEAN